MGLLSAVSGAVNSGISSVENALGISTGSPSSGGLPSAYAQVFRTIPTPVQQYALYRLSIHAPNRQKTPVEVFTFPLSPSSVRRTMTSMAAFYDTPGAPVSQFGVARIIDQYGMSPLTFVIEGTTGWQKHLTDGFHYTGLQAIRRIQTILEFFAYLNAGQAQAQKTDFYTMEFYDYFTREFYEVVPIGPQEIWQDKDRPILSFYRFTLVGLKPVSGPALPPGSTQDPIAAAFDSTVVTAQANFNTFMGGVNDLYSTASSVVSSVINAAGGIL